MGDKPGEGEGKPNLNDGKIEVKVGDEVKTYTAEDVGNMLNREASLTQKSQAVAAIHDAAAKYGLTPEQYVEQAEGSFFVYNKVTEAGLIDEKGNIIKTGPVVEDKPVVKDGQLQSPVIPDNAKVDTRFDTIATAIEGINKRLDKNSEDTTNVMKLGLKRDIMVKHPELDDADALVVLDLANQDPRKNIWEHAKDMVAAKATHEIETEKHMAKKFGINYEEWSKRNDQNIKGEEGAAAILGERRVVFAHRIPKDQKDNAISPREAMKEHFKKQDQRR